MSIRPDTPSATVFTFAGCRIGVDPLPASHRQWLREFLAPAFTLDDDLGNAGDHITHRITVCIDPARYRRWLQAGADGGEVDAFILDRGITRLPTWHHDSPGTLAYDDTTKVFYRVTARHSTVLSEFDRPALRIATARAIRELASTHVVRSGALLLHAAAFVIDGRAVIVAGPKRAGKTTLLLQALATGKAAYLSNDRLVVSTTADGPRVRGMPTIVSMRRTTLPLLPALSRRLNQHPYHFRSTLAEVHATSQVPANDRPRRTLTPAQLCELMSADAVAAAPPALLLFPEFSADRGAPELTLLNHQQTTEQINASRFGAPHPGRLSTLFGTPAPPPDTAATTRPANHPLVGLPAYRYHPGTLGSDNLAAIIQHLR